MVATTSTSATTSKPLRKPKTLGLKKAYQPLWLSIRFWHVPLSVLAHSRDRPAMVADKHRICACNRAAEDLGVQLGMPATVAQALVNTPLLTRDITAEQRLLQQLCDQYYGITPYIQTHYNQDNTIVYGISLEVSRCLTLFKNIQNIEHKVQECITNYSLQATVAYGHCANAAWLLSQQPLAAQAKTAITTKAKNTNSANTVPTPQTIFEQTLAQLKRLPVDYLEGFDKAIEQLHSMGFSYLGDLFDPSSPHVLGAIKKRFSADFCDYLDHLFACEGNFQPSLFQQKPKLYNPEITFFETLECEYPIANIEWLNEPCKILLQKLVDFLQQYQQQTQRIEWQLSDIHSNHQTLVINIERLHSNWPLALQLTDIQLSHAGLNFEVDHITLRCSQLLPVQLPTQNLFGQLPSTNTNFNTNTSSQTIDETLAITSAKITARLGEHALYKVSCTDAFIPENSMQKIAVNEQACSNIPAHHQWVARPNWLFETPKAISVRNQQLHWQGVLNICSTPERLQTGWWQQAVARDYYIAERDDHTRLWIYQDLHSQQWYVQGVFG